MSAPRANSSSELYSSQSGDDSDSLSNSNSTPSDPNNSPHHRLRPTESLTSRIATFKQQFLPQLREILGEEKYNLFQAENSRMASSGLEKQALKVGDIGPDFTLPNYDGSMYNLNNELQSHHVIVHFYRGAWCPYCNFSLQAHSEFLDEYDDYNATFVAITPQLPEVITTSVNQADHQYAFPILSDNHLEVIPAYHLLFTLSPELQQIHINGLNVSLAQYYGNDKGDLPIPATYILERKTGKIVWAHVEWDFTVRADPLDIIEELQKLKTQEESVAVNQLNQLGISKKR